MNLQQQFDRCLREAICSGYSSLILIPPDSKIQRPDSLCIEVDGSYIHIRVCKPGMNLKSVVVTTVFVVGNCDEDGVWFANRRKSGTVC